MQMDDFQQQVATLAQQAWPPARKRYMEKRYFEATELLMLLAEEVGELAKAVRMRHTGITTIRVPPDEWATTTRQQLIDELGDVLFLVARVAAHYELRLGNVAQAVLDKIQRRLEEVQNHAHMG